LLKLLRDQPIIFRDQLNNSAAVAAFAVQFRYDELPKDGEGAPPFDRTSAIALATLAIDWAEKLANSEQSEQ
jgi:hypothetical protein